MRFFAATSVALATLFCAPASAAAVAAQDAGGPTISAEQIDALVRSLDADEFLARETAMLQLLAAGPAVLDHLRPVLETGSLEATSRALFILKQLGASSDEQAQQGSWELLKNLAARQDAPVLVRRATVALEELVQQRKTTALAELEVLGARVVRGQFFNGIPLDEAVESLEVDDGFQGSDDDLRRLKWLSDVPKVVFSGTKVTDSWIAHAAAMPALEELHLYQAKVSDQCLAPLAEHKALRQVGIYYTPIGDEALAPLTKLPLLALVKLYGTRIRSQSVDAFRSSLPQVPPQRVDYRRGAFLGVGCTVVDGNCRISTVHDGSPADKGGILREDMVVRFGDAKVVTFDDLTAEISRRDVGDEVEIEVARQFFDEQGNPSQKNISTKVTLAPWEMDLAVRNNPRP